MIIAIIIILALALTLANSFSPSLSTLTENLFLRRDTDFQIETNVAEEQSTTPYTPQDSTSETSTPETQTLEITTKIVSGPKHNEVVDETNEITFRFELKVPDPEDNTRFETKVLGFDNDWKSTSSKKEL